MSFGLMPFDFFQNAMYLAMLEEAESGKAGTQPVKEYSSNRPKKSECFASAFLFSDFFGMFPCLKKSRGSGQSPVFITAINFVIFEKLLSRDFTSLTFVSLIISIQTKNAAGKKRKKERIKLDFHNIGNMKNCKSKLQEKCNFFQQHGKNPMQVQIVKIIRKSAEKYRGRAPRTRI